MKRLSIFLLLLFLSIPAYAGSWWPKPEPDQVISDNQIRENGCMRLSDILLLIDDWDLTTNDGYTWEMSANGLGTINKSDILIVVDGNPIDIEMNDRSNLNRLPIALSRIDRINVYSRPVVLAGTHAPQGAIEIILDNARDGVTYRGSVVHGEVSGDGGPNRYTPGPASPRMGAVADDQTHGGSFGYHNAYIAGDYRSTNHILRDQRLISLLNWTNPLYMLRDLTTSSTEGFAGHAGFELGTLEVNGIGLREQENQMPYTWDSDYSARFKNDILSGSATARFHMTDRLGMIVRAQQFEVESDLATYPDSIYFGTPAPYPYPKNPVKLERQSTNGALLGHYRAFHAELGHRLTSTTFHDPQIYESDPINKSWHERQSYLNGSLDLHDFTLEAHAVYAQNSSELSALSFGSWMDYRLNGRWRAALGMSQVEVLDNPMDYVERGYNGSYTRFVGSSEVNPSSFSRMDAEVSARLPYRIDLTVHGALQDDEQVSLVSYSGLYIGRYEGIPDDDLSGNGDIYYYYADTKGSIGLLSVKLHQHLTSRFSYRLSARWRKTLSGESYYHSLRDATLPLLISGSVRYDAPNHLTVLLRGSYRRSRVELPSNTLVWVDMTNELVSFDLTLTKGFWKNRLRTTLDFRNLTNRHQTWTYMGGSIYPRSYWLKVDLLLSSHDFF